MKLAYVHESDQFDLQFPETFPWHTVNSLAISGACVKIVSAIEQDLKTPAEERYLTAGLRQSLVIIAREAIIQIAP